MVEDGLKRLDSWQDGPDVQFGAVAISSCLEF